MHPWGGTPDRQGNNVFNDYNTENMFSESVAQFNDTQLVSARAPVHDAAAGTVAPPGQTKVETLRSFSAPLCTRDGGHDPLDSTFLRGRPCDTPRNGAGETPATSRATGVLPGAGEKKRSRRRGWNRDRRAPVLGVIVTAKSVLILINTAPKHIARSRRLPTMAVVTAHWWMKKVLRQNR